MGDQKGSGSLDGISSGLVPWLAGVDIGGQYFLGVAGKRDLGAHRIGVHVALILRIVQAASSENSVGGGVEFRQHGQGMGRRLRFAQDALSGDNNRVCGQDDSRLFVPGHNPGFALSHALDIFPRGLLRARGRFSQAARLDVKVQSKLSEQGLPARGCGSQGNGPAGAKRTLVLKLVFLKGHGMSLMANTLKMQDIEVPEYVWYTKRYVFVFSKANSNMSENSCDDQ